MYFECYGSTSAPNCCCVSSPDSLPSLKTPCMCCAAAKSCFSKGFSLVHSFVFLWLYSFLHSHLWTSWRAPELPIYDAPSAQCSTQSWFSATCLSVEGTGKKILRKIYLFPCIEVANCYLLRIWSLPRISALTSDSFFFRAVKLMNKIYKKGPLRGI